MKNAEKPVRERVSSPEQLNEHIRVMNPAAWAAFGVILLLLIAAVIWAAVGTITVRAGVGVLADGQSVVCYASPDTAMEPGMCVSVGEKEGVIRSVEPAAQLLTDENRSEATDLAGLETGDPYCLAQIDLAGLEAGAYKGTLTLETIHPICFVTG